MKKRVEFVLSVIFLAALVAWAFASAVHAQELPVRPTLRAGIPPPDVLVIVLDDVGWLHGHYGDPADPNTPQLDWLASQGVRFDNCYASATCQPSRVALMTGHNWTSDAGPAVGSVTPHTPLLAEKFLPERLATVGYTSALFGKWHLGPCRVPGWVPEAAPRSQGFPFWYQGTRANIQAWYVGTPTETVDYDYWQGVESETIHTYRTFQPQAMEDRFVQLYPLAPSPKLTVVCTNAPHAPFDPFPGCNQFGFPGYWYACAMEWMDGSVGRMLSVVDLRKTLVIVCGDNGSPPQVGGARAKATCYERGVRVPLIIAGAGVTAPGGTISDELVGLEDVFATALALAGATKGSSPYPVTSRDLGPILRGEPWTQRDHVVLGHDWQTPNADATRAIVSSTGWKLIQWDEDGDPNGLVETVSREELYNLNADPNETQDQIAAQPDLAAALRAMLDAEALP